jgi:sugar lactone lactonase YvrE
MRPEDWGKGASSGPHQLVFGRTGAGVVAIAAAAATVALGAARSGTITTVVGSGKLGFSGDRGPATRAKLFQPYGIAFDAKGNLYIADYGNDRVRKVSRGGTITTIAGSGKIGPYGDGGPATSAYVPKPRGIAVDGKGNVYISMDPPAVVRKISPDGTITRFAGGGTALAPGWGDGGPATGAQLSYPTGLAVDAQGNVYIAEGGNYAKIRKVSPAGVITTIAGGGSSIRDGIQATAAKLDSPQGIAVDRRGNLYIVEGGYGGSTLRRVRKMTPAGVITTIAGTGRAGFSGDGGPATKATLFDPMGVAVDRTGNVFIADRRNNRIRKVSPKGTITTFAGKSYDLGLPFAGDGGPATKARLAVPGWVAVDGRGNVYIADTGNNRVRKVWK